ncbi:hypothetical protein K1719_012980 [Acacia pycnantha]|nr:hypothetical protein K1719_012980 [Acacia pycnantha]
MGSAQLTSDFYGTSCPNASSTIKAVVESAVNSEKRMGASLLRLHFHDCFVQASEKTAFPNVNSLRGFDVIDNIKTQIEAICPGVVSCADILALAARDSVVALGGPSWDALLGRRDSTTASLSDANSDLPGPTLDLSDLITAFSNKGFTTKELVALSVDVEDKHGNISSRTLDVSTLTQYDWEMSGTQRTRRLAEFCRKSLNFANNTKGTL